MTRIVDDTFTEGSDTLLDAHTPDVGTGWTKQEGVPNANIVAADDAVEPTADNGGGLVYTCAPTPADEGVDEYNVNFVPFRANGDGALKNMGVVARWTDVDNWYGASLDSPASSAAN